MEVLIALAVLIVVFVPFVALGTFRFHTLMLPLHEGLPTRALTVRTPWGKPDTINALHSRKV